MRTGVRTKHENIRIRKKFKKNAYSHKRRMSEICGCGSYTNPMINQAKHPSRSYPLYGSYQKHTPQEETIQEYRQIGRTEIVSYKLANNM